MHEGQFPDQRGGFVNRQRYGLERSASANGRVPDAPNLFVQADALSKYVYENPFEAIILSSSARGIHRCAMPKWEEPMTWRYLPITAVVVFSAAPALAQLNMGSCTGPQDACKELAKVPQGFVAAYNSKDAATMATLFTQDATSVTDGPRIAFGRDAIEKDFEDAFKEGFSNLQATVATREITGDEAWGGGDWSAMGPGPNNKMQSIHGHWSNFYVREGGSWKIRVSVNMGTGRGF